MCPSVRPLLPRTHKNTFTHTEQMENIQQWGPLMILVFQSFASQKVLFYFWARRRPWGCISWFLCGDCIFFVLTEAWVSYTIKSISLWWRQWTRAGLSPGAAWWEENKFHYVAPSTVRIQLEGCANFQWFWQHPDGRCKKYPEGLWELERTVQ